jgi:uncharacterized protein (TIGR02118 family)
MIKAILTVKRRAELTHAEFRDRYEAVHAPLAVSLLPTLRGYTRNFVSTANGAEPPFDVITEFWYDDEAGQNAVREFYLSEAGKVLRDDEIEFMDRASMTFYVVDERVSDIKRA